ncbi:RNA polymerase factor sigma-32 [Anaplasma marginale]|nr:RNA polymerase factor sigma-32 [Anaplasma marginale]AXW84546.1 RNA polymerase factor sigma-32 [Anaplasma marginale]AXW85480.1 RNA polymerase factor sigma-32 [Anaplasma marginale]KAA8472483.1 sigma-70 family RNA polymerase sigma factor [Anaplasma marginale]KAB0450886.1 sigma-70 family RNA polymerase sigma factor [Anaplasma marginale]KAB0452737.1 sigma-70 family RNA polymerase sigma factor [Anaplasma marginale]
MGSASGMLTASVFSYMGSDDLVSYVAQVRTFPILSEEEEKRLAENWYRRGSVADAHRLVTSHLRLVVKIAMGFKSYGLPIMELIMEGNIGLMQAVKRFNPDLGFRLATYAVWWIKASIKDYILRSWSCIRVGTTQAQKKLFFSLRKIKKRLLSCGSSMTKKEIKAIAEECATSEEEVERMDRFFANRDVSLNEQVHGESSVELQDLVPSSLPSQEIMYLADEESAIKKSMFDSALATLDDRHRDIFTRRRLQERPDTLEKLSEEYGVSKERVRQIELQALCKIKSFIEANRVNVGC